VPNARRPPWCASARAGAERAPPQTPRQPIALYHTRDLREDGDHGWTAPYAAPDRWAEAYVPIGRARTYGDATDLTLVTWAYGLYLSLRVAARLAAEGIGCRVVDLRWLAPLPVDDVVHEAEATGRVLVVDETRRSGGVAEGVLAGLVDAGFTGRMARVASADSFVPSATPHCTCSSPRPTSSAPPAPWRPPRGADRGRRATGLTFPSQALPAGPGRGAGQRCGAAEGESSDEGAERTWSSSGGRWPGWSRRRSRRRTSGPGGSAEARRGEEEGAGEDLVEGPTKTGRCGPPLVGEVAPAFPVPRAAQG
jgi:hypothetical protein